MFLKRASSQSLDRLLSPLQHEEASVKMFDHLVEDNDLKPVMVKYGLKLPEDLVFIREQIVGPSNSVAGHTQQVRSYWCWGGWDGQYRGNTHIHQ